MAVKNRNDLTKERLLDEAETLFARKGYDGVSVRVITAAANCNLSAINYHFGNKQNLYMEVFRARVLPRSRRVHDFFKKALEKQGPFGPTNVVRSLAQAFLEGPLSDEERQRHLQLMTREISQPTEAFEIVFENVIKPFLKEMAERLSPFISAGHGEERMRLNILSIFFMVLHFNYARVAVTRVTGQDYDADFKSRLVDHILDFSLTGLGER